MCVFLLFVLHLVSHAAEHPAEEADAQMEAAHQSLKTAIQRVEKGIELIDDKEKQNATFKAFAASQKKWKEYIEAEIALFLAATPAPDTSTAAMLGGYYTEISATNARVKELEKLAEFLEANYKQQ